MVLIKLLFVVFCLVVGSVENLKKRLKEMGYSNKAVREILKWYK